MRHHDHDIKAPDGYLLGGIRLVRADGTILFGRGYWQAPDDWIGEKVWVHLEWKRLDNGRETLLLEAAQPGLHIYEARCMKPPCTVLCEPAERPDAKPAYRRSDHKALAARNAA